MGRIKEDFGNQITVTVGRHSSVNRWVVSVRSNDGSFLGTGKHRILDRALRKALKAAAGDERMLMTVEQYLQKQLDQRVQESEKTVRELRQQINALEGHCLEVAEDVEDVEGPIEAENLSYSIVEEPAGAITLNIPGRGILHFPADLCPQGRDARAEFIKTIMAALATTPLTELPDQDLFGPKARPLADLLRQQAGAWCDKIGNDLTALRKDFDQHVEDQMDRNMGFDGEDKLLAQTIGVAERRAVEADREITAMLAAAERQLISAVNILEERVAALETKRPTKETPK